MRVSRTSTRWTASIVRCRRICASICANEEVGSASPRQVDETLALALELRRAAASVPAELAEGYARSRSDYRQLVDIAKSSAAETSYRLTLARDLGYVPGDLHDSLAEDYVRIAKMLTRLGEALSRDRES